MDNSQNLNQDPESENINDILKDKIEAAIIFINKNVQLVEFAFNEIDPPHYNKWSIGFTSSPSQMLSLTDFGGFVKVNHISIAKKVVKHFKKNTMHELSNLQAGRAEEACYIVFMYKK